jgi:hypothetical protein
MPLLLLLTPFHSGIIISVILAPTLFQSFLLVVLSYVINLEIFLSAMLVRSSDTLNFHFIGCHLVPHNILN